MSLDTIVFGTVTVLDLLLFALAVIVTVIIAKVVSVYLKKSLSDRIEKEELAKLIKVVQISIILLGVWLALPSFDFDLGQILIIGGTVGIIIGFATQKIVSNFGSGVFLLIERPVKVGDTIRIENISGKVYQIRILSTIVKTDDGVYVRVPNEKVFTSDITNYAVNAARRCDYTIPLSSHDDPAVAIEVIRSLLESYPLILVHPSPLIFVSGLNDSGILLTVQMWTPSRVYGDVKNEMLGNIRQALEAKGIEIPSPRRIISFDTGTAGHSSGTP